jgi:hypothetical protein
VQSVGLLQSAIEAHWMATVALTFLPELTELVGTPRALSVRFPYGAAFGNPLNRWLQTRILRESLSLLTEATSPRTIRASAYRWRQTRDKVAW